VSSCIRSVVTGVGDFLPARVVTNDDLAKFVDTNDAWIVERTGIRQRREAGEGETTSDLATKAAERALAAAGRTPADVDLIVVGTTTPDLTFPAVATQVQRKLGCPVGIAFDVQAVCSGFVYALATADNFVVRGQSKCCLVIGAETMTRLMDWKPAPWCWNRAKGRAPPPTAACSAWPCAPTGPSRTCSTSMAAPRPRARWESSVCRATRCSATPWSTSPRR
jgi:3-oxoacyl-[acyl-carrier-protein] synthase III